MKKIFLLIPALVLALVTNAANVINIDDNTPDALRKALNNAADGDEIVMAAGTYVESNSGYILFTGKNVTVRAAAGAEVILVPKVQIRLKEGARAEFIGIKFDCGHLSDLSSYSNLIATADNTDGKKLILKDCEFYGWTQDGAILRTPSDKKIDSIIINNCHFHDCYKSVLYCEDPNLIGVEINNSTFANVNGTYWAAPIYVPATSGKLVVDHCTFYNVEQADAGSAVVTTTLADATVSNCIFMYPTSGDICATKLPAGGDVKNCLTYNYDNWQPYGHYKTATVTDCVKANPLFKDAANADFTLRAGSPARGAATDASAIGDPRWAGSISPIETAISSDLVLEPADAVHNEYFKLDADLHFKSNNPDEDPMPGYGIATWQIHVTREVATQIKLHINSGSLYGHTYKVEIINTTTDEKAGESSESGWTNVTGEVAFSNVINLSEGDYTVKLSNTCKGSVALLDDVTLSYAGGNVQTLKNDASFLTNLNDAMFSSNGTRDNGKISFPGASMASAWVRWNLHVETTDYYDVVINFDKGDADHNCGLKLYSGENIIFDKHAVALNHQTSAASPLSLGRFLIPAGDYIMEFTNPVTNSTAKLISIKIDAFVAPTTALPATLKAKDAILSEKAYTSSTADDAELYFAPGGSNPQGEWAQWKVSVAAPKTLLFTMKVTSENGHSQSYKLTILDNSNKVISVKSTDNLGHGDKTITHYAYLPTGNYFVKAENTFSHSNGHMVELKAEEVDNLITLDENDNEASSPISANIGKTKNVQLIRSLKGGMYNTLCLPFTLYTAMAKEAFGDDVEVYKFEDSELEGDILNLSFKNAEESGGVSVGWPMLIKPSKDVANPVFSNVEIVTDHPETKTTPYAWLKGNFIRGTIPEDKNNLFLGPNNTLYFPENGDKPILGMRAYFILQEGARSIISRARIVAQGEEVSAVELVNSENNSRKVIEDGQLIIIRDGVRYNVMGIVIEK